MLRTLCSQSFAEARPAPAALELGAGGALPSLLAAVAGHQMLATDGDTDVVALMRKNFALNGLVVSDGIIGTGRASALMPRKLDWTDASDVDAVLADWPRGFPLIVAADVFWNCDSMEQFLASVPKLLDIQLSSPPLLLLAMSDDLFLDLTSHVVKAAASYGLQLMKQDSVTGASVATSAYGTVLREDSMATLLVFRYEHCSSNPTAEAVNQKQARQAALAAKHEKSHVNNVVL